MRSLLQLTIAAASMATLTTAFTCDIPTNGCTNGMFSVEKCECECIEPYCPDWFGDCTNPTGSCGGNPWTECTRGIDCPWWPNPLSMEACTTGPKVPLDMWTIYNTRSACCNSKFPYSDICTKEAEEEGPPTKYPTIQSPEEDIFEVVPIKFDVMGLPEDISMRELKDEMTIVLKRILLRLADRIEGLKVTQVEERVVVTRSLIGGGGTPNKNKKMRNLQKYENREMIGELHHRGLEQDVTLYFNVYVLREENRKFGPLIINDIKENYGEVLEQVQTFADTKFFGGDLKLNWCTAENGEFVNCVEDITPKMPARAPTPITIQSDTGGGSSGGGALAGWAIALIIIIALLVVGCIGYAIAVFCFGVASCCGGGNYDDHQTKEINNNIYGGNGGGGYRDHNERNMYTDEEFYDDRGDGRSRRSRGGRSRRSRGGGRSRRHDDDYEDDGDGDVQIVLAEPQDPKFEDDAFTVSTYATRATNKRPGKDPTMYIPGQEGKPDPDSDMLMITGGDDASGRTGTSRRYYSEDPPLKPKRDPTMYVQGGHGNYSAEDPPLKPKRDPTMYVDGGDLDPSVYGDGGGGHDPSFHVDGQRDPTMYVDGEASSVEAFSIGHSSHRGGSKAGASGYSSGDPYGMGGIDDSEYDQQSYGFGASDMEEPEYVRGRKDPSYYAEDQSFRTQEPSVAGESKRKKKSKKKSNR